MAKLLKPLRELVFSLKNDIFIRTRFQLLLLLKLYIVLLAAVLFLVMYYGRTYVIEDIVTNSTIDEVVARGLGERLGRNLNQLSAVVYLAVFLIMVTFSSVFASIAIRKIGRIIERKKRFIANASHELQTPLSIIRSNCEVALMSAEQLPPQAQDVIKSNLEEAIRLSTIINNMLTLSSVQQVGQPMVFAPIVVKELIDSTIHLVKARAEQKNIKLVTEVNMGSLKVLGSATGLEEVLVNLIKNAISHTQFGGTVVVKAVFIKNEFVEIAVQDFGPGIPKKEIRRIFEPFYRGIYMANFEDSTHGLGLAIVKEIIERHEGVIIVDSIENIGTTFRVRLPL